MASDAEPAKLLLPFLQRADELQKHEPLVAYYCRLYAMDRGLKIPQKERTKTTNALLVSLMNQLEKDKKSLKLGSEDSLYVEGFASNVFAKADKQDRARRADLNTAKTFYAASIFYEVLNQFGELAPDIEQKLKYAVWKAADIRKALKEGRKPEPGPPGGDEDLLMPSSSPSNANVLDSNESAQTSFSSGLSSDQTKQDLGRESRSYENFPSQPPQHKDMVRGESYNFVGANVSSHAMHPDPGHNESLNYSGANTSSSQLAPQSNPHVITHTANTSPPSSYSQDYSTGDYSQSSQPYLQNYHQSYTYEHQPFPPNFSPENPNPPYSYPNFQSYPSFQETSFPSAPTHQPSYYHGPNIPPAQESTVQYSSPSSNGNHAGPSISPPSNYKYDSNYQPSVEKIADAHKAARFAVGALAFDDVPVAVEFLRKSLELLTNPHAESH